MTALLLLEYQLPTEAVSDYAVWKEVFDTDPMGREAHGATGHRIFRYDGDENHFLLMIEFPTHGEARRFLDDCGDMGFTGVRQSSTVVQIEAIAY